MFKANIVILHYYLYQYLTFFFIYFIKYENILYGKNSITSTFIKSEVDISGHSSFPSLVVLNIPLFNFLFIDIDCFCVQKYIIYNEKIIMTINIILFQFFFLYIYQNLYLLFISMIKKL